ncbi:protein of unknown function [Candidatus Nitrosocosmicus franklandus]|uniref:Uncharacterized protein n=1 Tax=Candidatus Nitrosocosmicus franklandianus TaxID=1798806 RepID=A0A484IBT9_9ARCH|nr:protein of unknown function [Candidatus Nitrosocosmicus franklandus]
MVTYSLLICDANKAMSNFSKIQINEVIIEISFACALLKTSKLLKSFKY